MLVDTSDVEAFINCVRYLGPSFGGINLEDIKAPDCFIIEQRLKELMDIPVFHDDQHGTAIIAAAGVINGMELTGRKFEKTRIVVNGAGAAAISCLDMLVNLGMPRKNILSRRYEGRRLRRPQGGHEPVEVGYAAKTKARTLADAMEGADIFFGLSVAGAVTKEMVAFDGRRMSDDLRDGEPRSRDHAGGYRDRARRRHRGERAAPTIRTRSTTCWASRSCSAARSMCRRRRSTTR